MKHLNVLLQALEDCISVQSLVNGINSVSSRFTIVLIVNAMAWFCYYFTFMTGDRKTSTSGRGWIARAEFGVCFTLVVFCVIQAAEACNKVRPLSYTCWIRITIFIWFKFRESNWKVYKFTVGDMRLGTMLDTICLQKYISEDKLGVKAGNFTISYSLLVTVISQALVYTKIIRYRVNVNIFIYSITISI